MITFPLIKSSCFNSKTLQITTAHANNIFLDRTVLQKLVYAVSRILKTEFSDFNKIKNTILINNNNRKTILIFIISLIKIVKMIFIRNSIKESIFPLIYYVFLFLWMVIFVFILVIWNT